MKKGVTLVEVMVAATILAMGLSSTLYSYVVCQRAMIQNTHRMNASIIINKYFEVIQNLETESALESTISYYSVPKRVYTTYNRNMLEDYELTISKTAVISPIDGSDLSILTATVTWEDRAPQKTLSMSIFSNEPL